MAKISAYISYYYDYEYLNLCLSNFASLVDEIIICDGPFEYMIQDLINLNIPMHMNDKDLKIIHSKYKNIQYCKGIFEDEFQKRKYAYNKCSGDIILIIDSDEMINITEKDFIDFENSDAAVGCVSFINLCQLAYSFNEKIVGKNILFKKNSISAEDHLDYTWLVGYDDQRKSTNLKIKYYTDVIVYHYSLMRPKESLVIKYLFYVNLWCKTYSKSNNFLENLQQYNLSIDQIKNIFVRAKIEGIGFPNSQKIHKKWIKNHKLDKQEKQIQNLITKLDFQQEDYIISNIGMFGLIPIGKNSTIITFEEKIKTLEYTVYPIYIDSKNDVVTQKNIVTDCNKVQIEFNSNLINCLKIEAKGKNEINRIKDLDYG